MHYCILIQWRLSSCFFNLLNLSRGEHQVTRHRERLTHLFEVGPGCLNCQVCAQVLIFASHLIPDPLGHFIEEVFSLVALVRKNHHPIIVL